MCACVVVAVVAVVVAVCVCVVSTWVRARFIYGGGEKALIK